MPFFHGEFYITHKALCHIFRFIKMPIQQGIAIRASGIIHFFITGRACVFLADGPTFRSGILDCISLIAVCFKPDFAAGFIA
jgi:hypothetical protein